MGSDTQSSATPAASDSDRRWNATPCIIRHPVGLLASSPRRNATGRPSAVDVTVEPAVSTARRQLVPVVDLTGLSPLVLRLPQQWAGRELEQYEWVVSWCTPSKLRTDGTSACGEPSFVAQYSDGTCRTNFFNGLRRELLLGPGRTRQVLGVVLQSHVDLLSPPRRKYMEVVVRCAWDMPEGSVAADDGVEAVPVDTVQPVPNRRYTIRLRSRCACAGGCGEAKATAELLADVPDRQLDAWIAEKAGLKAAETADVFESGTLFAECFEATLSSCLELPACDYDVVAGYCRPSVNEWVLVAKQDDGVVASCSHIGGDGVSVVSLIECQTAAVKMGANAVNYRTWTPHPPAVMGRHERAPVVNPDGGCYYKLCSVGELFRGRNVTSVAVEGFNVWVRNPFFVSDSDAAAFEAVNRI